MPSVVGFKITTSPQARLSYLALSSIQRASLSTSTKRSRSAFDRSDFQGQPFTGSYEPGQPTRGPLGEASTHGAPRVTPTRIKEYFDQYVISQDVGKKILATSAYNHYQRVQEIKRRDDEQQERLEQEHRRRFDRETHPVLSQFLYAELHENDANINVLEQRIIQGKPKLLISEHQRLLSGLTSCIPRLWTMYQVLS